MLVWTVWRKTNWSKPPSETHLNQSLQYSASLYCSLTKYMKIVSRGTVSYQKFTEWSTVHICFNEEERKASQQNVFFAHELRLVSLSLCENCGQYRFDIRRSGSQGQWSLLVWRDSVTTDAACNTSALWLHCVSKKPGTQYYAS